MIYSNNNSSQLHRGELTHRVALCTDEPYFGFLYCPTPDNFTNQGRALALNVLNSYDKYSKHAITKQFTWKHLFYVQTYLLPI